MFIKNKYSQTDNNTLLWRYLSFSKFLDILETSSLYFRRIDCFKDKLEATQPYGAAFFAKSTENPWQVFGYQCVEKQLEIYQNMTFACCWHINSNENPDMWKNYVTEHGNEGVAIKTTFRHLSECFDTERALTNLKMKYIDYATDFLDYSYPNYPEYLSIKDKQYEYENELRIITLEPHYPEYDPDTLYLIEKPQIYTHKGEHIKVRLNKLIEELYLCPNSTDRFKSIVIELLKKCDINVPVVTSNK